MPTQDEQTSQEGKKEESRNIRLVRVLTYDYKTEEALIKDIGHWHLGLLAKKDTGQVCITSYVSGDTTVRNLLSKYFSVSERWLADVLMEISKVEKEQEKEDETR